MSDCLVAKLRPDRFTGMSPRMAAVVGHVLGERFTEPAIAEMVVTSDGIVLARAEGDDNEEVLGREADLDRNLHVALAAAVSAGSCGSSRRSRGPSGSPLRR
jgi:hypothetical protein